MAALSEGFLLGIDIGTSSAKGILIDNSGKIYARSSFKWSLFTKVNGLAEQNAEDYWLGTVQVIRELLGKSKISAGQVMGVGLSGQAPSCVLVDKETHPLRPVHTWMDRRGERQADDVKKLIGDEKIFKISGNGIDPYYGFIKLLWEKSEEPSLYKAAYKMLQPKDFVAARFTGEMATDESSAALNGIGFDIRRGKWNSEILQTLDMDSSKLPRILKSTDVVGRLTPSAAKETGLVKGTPVIIGAVDAQAAWVAIGLEQFGESGLTLGTSACLGVVHHGEDFPKDLINMPFVLKENRRYMTVGVVATGGALVQWFDNEFGQLEKQFADEYNFSVQSAYSLYDRLIQSVPAGSEGLIALPYFMGERNPIWNPHARGVIFGLSLSHKRGHVLRSLIEGMSYAIRHNMDTIRLGGIELSFPLHLTEGISSMKSCREIVTEVLQVHTEYHPNDGGAAFGAAVLAGLGVGYIDSLKSVKSWLSQGEQQLPSKDFTAVYDGLYERYRQLYPALKNFFTHE